MAPRAKKTAKLTKAQQNRQAAKQLVAASAPPPAPEQGASASDTSAPAAGEQKKAGYQRSAEASVDQAVIRAIKQHCACYGKHINFAEVIVEPEGVKLFDHVRKYFVAARSINKNLTPSWWDTLHTKIAGAVFWEPLKAEVFEEPPQAFTAALAQCEAKNPADRKATKIEAHLRLTVKDFTESMIVQLFNCLGNTFKRQCKFSLSLALTVAKFIVRKGIKVRFGAHTKRILHLLDKSVTDLWSREGHGKDGLTEVQFIDKHRGLCDLIMAGEKTEAVVTAKKKKRLCDVAHYIKDLTEQSTLGKSMFTGMWSEVRGEQFSRSVAYQLKSLLSLSPQCVRVALPRVREDLAELAEAASADPAFRPAATIDVEYLGVAMKLPAGDATVEVALRIDIALKDLSCGYRNGLKPLPYESWLVPERANMEAIIEVDELVDAEAARDDFIKQAGRQGHTALCQMRTMVDSEKKIKVFSASDPFWILEATFLKHYAEKACVDAFRGRVWEALPSCSRDMDLQASIRILQGLEQSDMIRIGHVGDASLFIEDVLLLVRQMKQSEGPSLGTYFKLYI